MEIIQVYWRETGCPGARVDAAMLAADGGLFGALVNGKPVLMEYDGTLLSLPAALQSETWTTAALSSAGAVLALASSSKLVLFNLETHTLTENAVNDIFQLTWEPTGKYLGIGHNNSALSFWGIQDSKLEQRSLSLRRHRWWLVSFAGNTARLFTASSSGYPFANWLCAVPLVGDVLRYELPRERYVTGLAPIPAGTAIALSDHSGHYEVLTFSEELQLLKKVTFQAAVTTLAATSAQPWLAAGTVNGELWLLDAKTLAIVSRRMLWPTAPIRTLAACGEGYILAGASDGRLALVELY